MRHYYFLAGALFLSSPALAQSDPASGTRGVWAAGTGLGTGLEAHGGYMAPHWLAFSRVRYKWWGPESGPGSGPGFSSFNTRSRQLEVAVLAGGVLPLGNYLAYGATGLSYVAGRQLGDYRYTTFDNDVFTDPDPTYYYAYRDYQAIGLPLEISLLAPPLGQTVRLGVSVQANLNPAHSEYCVFLTAWAGNFSKIKNH